MTRVALALALVLTGCAGTSANAATCTAYDHAVEVARKACHWTCDRIPRQCPWRSAGGPE